MWHIRCCILRTVAVNYCVRFCLLSVGRIVGTDINPLLRRLRFVNIDADSNSTSNFSIYTMLL
ncbi:hypothetical protein PR003_g17482 [Phytophthora rubi]|uniref:Uncharacterized protein n=1 Tax=Phytophthora rubi TaxID=129364 RepID=A0A6A3H787_9STRA|nr:hypothetical protein PR001_g28979 [Phytophthora rubi]KAE8968190.1 hypothetical protein PR002_g27837 [Phytophthora rubi]KAE9321415.1 hypothetical protein PR003_g17482 [Phytophthora rubi]